MKYEVTFARAFVQEATVEIEADSETEAFELGEKHDKKSLAWGEAEPTDVEVSGVYEVG